MARDIEGFRFKGCEGEGGVLWAIDSAEDVWSFLNVFHLARFTGADLVR